MQFKLSNRASVLALAAAFAITPVTMDWSDLSFRSLTGQAQSVGVGADVGASAGADVGVGGVGGVGGSADAGAGVGASASAGADAGVGAGAVGGGSAGAAGGAEAAPGDGLLSRLFGGGTSQASVQADSAAQADVGEAASYLASLNATQASATAQGHASNEAVVGQLTGYQNALAAGDLNVAAQFLASAALDAQLTAETVQEINARLGMEVDAETSAQIAAAAAQQ